MNKNQASDEGIDRRGKAEKIKSLFFQLDSLHNLDYANVWQHVLQFLKRDGAFAV